MDYRRQVLNQFALQRVSVPIYKPIATLGVGEDEERRFMKLEMVNQGVSAGVKAPSELESAYSMATIDKGKNIKQSDLPQNEFYLGESITGF